MTKLLEMTYIYILKSSCSAQDWNMEIRSGLKLKKNCTERPKARCFYPYQSTSQHQAKYRKRKSILTQLIKENLQIKLQKWSAFQHMKVAIVITIRGIGKIVIGSGNNLLRYDKNNRQDLMFFWPCIMNWLYINYQLDALIIIY
jgi:hypothetical protein